MPYKDPEENKRCKAEWRKRKLREDPDYKYNKIRFGREYRLRIRRAVLAFYGNKCQCCGETEPNFLSLDHINGGGNKHRKREKITSLYVWAFKNGFPNILQILCHNCNMAKGVYGICPHQTEGK